MGLSLASAAFADTATPPSRAAVSPPDDGLQRSAAQDQADANAMTATLAALDARIVADEVRMTQLRDADLARSAARIRAIKPALPFHGPTFLPHWY